MPRHQTAVLLRELDRAIGKRLREQRRTAGVTVSDVAVALGDSPTLVSKWEAGEIRAPASAVAYYADRFGVDVRDLMGVRSGGDEALDRPDIRRLIRVVGRLSPTTVAALMGLIETIQGGGG